MRLSRDLVHNHSPEYRQALQELIKFELQALVERLSATGEEALILTASSSDGSLTQFGSTKAEGFLTKHSTLGTDFLTYCNDDPQQSSADELGNSGDDIESSQKGEGKEVSSLQYPTVRKRERTSSKRLSTTETPQDNNIYEVSQNSDISGFEKNDSASSVSSFVEAKESKSDLQCKICSRKFRSYRSLNQHFRLHMAKSYKCGICGKIFSMRKSHQRHVRTHHKDTNFDCAICDKSFSDHYSFQRHREGHVSIRNYSCDLCGKAFYEKYSLRVHQTSHFNTQKVDRNFDSMSGYPCHICQKISKTKNALKNHMLTHSAKKHTCEFCNKRFSLKYSYVRHRRIHTGEKPYKCGSCDRSFSDGSAWTKHILTHSATKPYSCTICTKSFSYKTACKNHMKSHHGKKTKQSELRNFKIISTNEKEIKYDSVKITVEEEDDIVRSKQLAYESDSESRLYGDEINLQLEESDKDFEGSNLLDSGFEANILPSPGKEAEEKETTELIGSVDLDERFQTEFVERNMPIKGLESVNELISTDFPDDTELLEDDTETDNQVEIQHGLKEKIIGLSPLKQSLRKIQRRPAMGKQLPEMSTKCRKCHKVFPQESALKQHLQFHCMMKLYKCRYCGKQLSTKNSLVRHERIHIGDRPYQCYICQKKFADNYGCIRHIKLHFTSDDKSSTASGSIQHAQTLSKPHAEKRSPPSVSSLHKTTDSHLKPCADIFSESRATKQSYNEEERFIETNTYTHVKQSYQEKEIQQYTSPSAVTKQSENLNIKPANKSETSSTYSYSSSVVSLVNSDQHLDSKQWFKCFACSTLFETQQKCIDHIEQDCGTKPKDSLPMAKNSKLLITKSDDGCQLKSLYQCSLCSKMFDTETSCQTHIQEDCLKSQASTECASQSILNETLQYSDLGEVESQETLPQLPFTELDSDQNYLTMDPDNVMFLPEPYNCPESTSSVSNVDTSVVESAKNSPTYIPVTQLANQANTSIQFCSNNQTAPQLQSESIPYTGLVQKPLVNIGQSKFVVTNQGISLYPSSSVTNPPPAGMQDRKAKKAETDVSDRTCTICSKVFTTKHILKQHTLIHMERKFECKYCMKKFHNKYGRDRHERIHTGEKPFTCPSCRKAFSDNSTYRKHTRVCCSGK